MADLARSTTERVRAGARPALIGMAAAVVVMGIGFAGWRQWGPRALTVVTGAFPEELVYVRTQDELVQSGALFRPRPPAKPVAILWIHGWGTNFASPTYTMIGRALAGRGFTTISGNTRMHDLGNVAGYRGEKRVRGGGYWGVASEEALDLRAWIDFAESQGFGRVVLAGHSAGWAAVRGYQYARQDPRVAGVVLASGAVRAEMREPDAEQLAEAKRLVAAGEGEALIRDPKRSFPSYTSAATFLDIAAAPAETRDFFGVSAETRSPGITRVRCPLLAFFGTKGDVGNEEDLELLRTAILRQPSGPSRVETALIQGGDHMYTGEEAQVARTIGEWVDRVVLR